jgi:hypothetical protein
MIASTASSPSFLLGYQKRLKKSTCRGIQLSEMLIKPEGGLLKMNKRKALNRESERNPRSVLRG